MHRGGLAGVLGMMLVATGASADEGGASVWLGGLNSAVKPVVVGMVRAAEAAAWTAGLVCDWAMPVRLMARIS